jgi:hypothetical protein
MEYSPFTCPICFESFDSSCRPVTFPCGHTCCLDDATNLTECFACRSRLPPMNELNKNITLIECCEKFEEVSKKLEYVQVLRDASVPTTVPSASAPRNTTKYEFDLSCILWLIKQKWVWTAALGAYIAYIVLRLYSGLCHMVGSFLSVFTAVLN